MDISVESDHYIQELCLISAGGITYIIGLMIHFFIVGVSVIDWLRGRPLTPADLLITYIGTSRIFFQCISLFDLFWITVSKNFSMAYFVTFAVLGNSSLYSNIWLSVLLSVFYTLKISNFHNVLFLYLKKIISQRLLGLTVTFVLLSIGYSSIDVLAVLEHSLKNSSQADNPYDIEIKKLKVFLPWKALPFLIYVFSFLALLGSLCRHMYRMKCDQNVTSHLDTYYKTIKFTIASFFCFALYVTTNMVMMFYFSFLSFAGFFLVLNWFPMLHSMYIIYMSGRLRRHFLKILHNMTKCLLLSRGSESRSEVQLQVISQ